MKSNRAVLRQLHLRRALYAHSRWSAPDGPSQQPVLTNPIPTRYTLNHNRNLSKVADHHKITKRK